MLGRKTQSGLAGVGLQRIFRALQLDAHLLDLPREPLAGLPCGLPARFQNLRNKLAGERVGELRRGCRVGGVGRDFQNPCEPAGPHLDPSLRIRQGSFATVDRRLLRHMESPAPGGDKAQSNQIERFVVAQLVQNAPQQRFAEQNPDLRLQVGSFRSSARFGHRIHLLGVEKVVVDPDDLDGRPRLVDRSLRQGPQQAGQCAPDGKQDHCAFAAPQGAPEFQGTGRGCFPGLSRDVLWPLGGRRS